MGPFAVAALRTIHVDLVFVGVHGMDPRSGFTCPNLLEADTDRALIEAGRRLVVVADHSKWGVIGISSIARLDQADVLVTDAGLAPEARIILTEAVRELIVVDPAPPAGARRPAPTGAAPSMSTDGEGRPVGDRPAGRRAAPPLQPADGRVGARLGRADPPAVARAPRSPSQEPAGLAYDPDCYLCPGNTRANGNAQPGLHGDLRLPNDFAALRPDTSDRRVRRRPAPRGGRARVVPGRVLLARSHDLTLGRMARGDVRRVDRRVGRADGRARRRIPLGPGLREPGRGDGRVEPASARPDLGRHGTAR